MSALPSELGDSSLHLFCKQERIVTLRFGDFSASLDFGPKADPVNFNLCLILWLQLPYHASNTVAPVIVNFPPCKTAGGLCIVWEDILLLLTSAILHY